MASAAAAYERAASHAGSWYSDSRDELAGQLQGWIDDARADPPEPALPPAASVRAVVAPHAGYSFSGPTAAHAYCAVDPAAVRRVFVLGPSHRKQTRRCELGGATVLRTPVGDLRADLDTANALRATGRFGRTRQREDEEEHSIEMHLPYLAHVLRGRDVPVVCVMVGATSGDEERAVGAVLAPYLDDPGNLFVVSTDFCHWGERFGYTRHDPADGEVWQSIERLDRLGMASIETGDPARFAAYQREYRNTVCGRHAVGVFMHAARAARTGFRFRFVRYAQSSRCRSTRDSSVSYASAVVTAEP